MNICKLTPKTEPKDYPIYPKIDVTRDKNLVVIVQRGPNFTHTITLDSDAQKQLREVLK